MVAIGDVGRRAAGIAQPETADASPALLAAAFEMSPDAIAINRAEDGMYIEVNAGFEGLSGWSSAELVGRTSLEVGIWSEPGDRARLVGELGRTGSVRDMEFEFCRKDGSRFYGMMSATILEAGGIKCLLSVTRDMTARMEAEAAVRASEEKFSVAFRSSPDVAVISRIGGGEILEVNDGFFRLTGWSAGEVIGRTVFDLGLWSDEATRLAFLDSVLDTGGVSGMDGEFCRRDGKLITMVLTARTITVAGEECLLTYARDVTEQRAAVGELGDTVRESFEVMGHLVELRDPYTQGHQERVGLLAEAIAAEMGLPGSDAATLRTAGAVHDIGKMQVPAEILSRPGRLNDLEFALVKSHSIEGYRILDAAGFSRPMAELVLKHHERMDGSGYPQGLTADDIPLMARILCVADVAEAMASHRPYRPALGMDAAMAELEGNPEKFDQCVVSALRSLFDRGGLPI